MMRTDLEGKASIGCFSIVQIHPIGDCRYWNRNLNPREVILVKWSLKRKW